MGLVLSACSERLPFSLCGCVALQAISNQLAAALAVNHYKAQRAQQGQQAQQQRQAPALPHLPDGHVAVGVGMPAGCGEEALQQLILQHFRAQAAAQNPGGSRAEAAQHSGNSGGSIQLLRAEAAAQQGSRTYLNPLADMGHQHNRSPPMSPNVQR